MIFFQAGKLRLSFLDISTPEHPLEPVPMIVPLKMLIVFGKVVPLDIIVPDFEYDTNGLGD
jgi:hypothetical protein